MTDPISQQVQAILGAALSSLKGAPPHPLQTPSPPTTPPPVMPPAKLADANPAPPPPTPDPVPATPAPSREGLPFWYSPEINSATFNLNVYLKSIPNLATLLTIPQGRRAATATDPLLFALTYLPHHLKDPNKPNQPPSFADCHFDWARRALRWAANRNRTTPIFPQEDRNAEIAPRMCGKSTWWFLIVPMWAAAHGHKRFVAAFASTSTQAEGHLKTFKNELDNNRYLRQDFPDLCSPKRRPRGAVVADRIDSYQAQSGFVFVAKGVDSSNLGMKVEEVRPDLILLDDVEPDESSYSADLAEKRLKTIQDAILQLNIYASVVFVGTVTMPNSIIHQLVKAANNTERPDPDWIADEKIKPHHYLPIVYDPATSTERSLWPEKWSLEYLRSIQHTRSYAKNYANDPKGLNGDYWNAEDFTYATMPRTRATRTALFVDPPTTKSKTSDPAGLAIVSWNAPNTEQQQNPFTMEAPRPVKESGSTKKRAMNRRITRHPGIASVDYADHVKLTGKPLAKYCYNVIAENPHLNIRMIIVEATQGGDLWHEVFADSPVIVKVVNPRQGKETRFERALEYYQKQPTLVLHNPDANLRRLEEQQMGFPKARFDDIADAAVTGILYFLEPRPSKNRIRSKVVPYV